MGPNSAIDAGVGLIRVGPSVRENPRAAAATIKIKQAENVVKKNGSIYAPKLPVQVRFCMDLVSLSNTDARVQKDIADVRHQLRQQNNNNTNN